MVKIFKTAFILAMFCVIAAGSLAVVYLFTKPRIENNIKMIFDSALREALPAAERFQEEVYDGRTKYVGLKGSAPQGFALLVAPQGYSGKIEMLVGVDSSGKVSGLKILSHRETPGLGANIEKASFLEQFKGKRASDKIEPKVDVDAITGATISSRAVCQGVREALKAGRVGNK